MKKGLKVFLFLLAIVIIISFLGRYDGIAQPVSEWIGQPIENVKAVAKLVFFCALAAFLIFAGVASLAIPIVGVVLIAAGLILLSVTLYNWFKTPTITKD